MPRRYQYRAMAKRMGLKPKRKVATVQTVKKMIGKSIETKMLEASNNHTGGNTWTVSCLSNAVQGDGVGDRAGNKITPTYLRYSVQTDVHASNSLGEIVRVVILADKEARGVVPSMPDLNLPNTADGGRYIALNPANQFNRYKILSDKVYNMTTDNNFMVKTGSIKLKTPIKFGTDADDYQENSIFCAVWSYDNTNKSTVGVRSRLYFKDA